MARFRSVVLKKRIPLQDFSSLVGRFLMGECYIPERQVSESLKGGGRGMVGGIIAPPTNSENRVGYEM
jgi:hypothetical protein